MWRNCGNAETHRKKEKQRIQQLLLPNPPFRVVSARFCVPTVSVLCARPFGASVEAGGAGLDDGLGAVRHLQLAEDVRDIVAVSYTHLTLPTSDLV